MKISKRQLRRIIKEEKLKLLNETFNNSSMEVYNLLDFVRDELGISDSEILEHILATAPLEISISTLKNLKDSFAGPGL